MISNLPAVVLHVFLLVFLSSHPMYIDVGLWSECILFLHQYHPASQPASQPASKSAKQLVSQELLFWIIFLSQQQMVALCTSLLVSASASHYIMKNLCLISFPLLYLGLGFPSLLYIHHLYFILLKTYCCWKSFWDDYTALFAIANRNRVAMDRWITQATQCHTQRSYVSQKYLQQQYWKGVFSFFLVCKFVWQKK